MPGKLSHNVADPFMLDIYAAVAGQERNKISGRIKVAGKKFEMAGKLETFPCVPVYFVAKKLKLSCARTAAALSGFAR